jgi:REP element-mobilizing transposase RayT
LLVTTSCININGRQDGGITCYEAAMVSQTTDATPGLITIRDRGRLPHWETEGGTYFVTFRLADSLPVSVLQALEAERENITRTAQQMKRDLSPSERQRLAELLSERIETYLDAGAGACHLADPRIAEVVAQALRFFDHRRYQLRAWCVMPNHVHVVLRLFPGQSLAAVLHSWKSFTAKEANRILGTTGRFWQREYYDHLVRDEAECARIVRYVIENPAKAHLRNWPWAERCQT